MKCGEMMISIFDITQYTKMRKYWLPAFLLFFFINPLPDVPILGFSNSAAKKDMMSKIWQMGIQFYHITNLVSNVI